MSTDPSLSLTLEIRSSTDTVDAEAMSVGFSGTVLLSEENKLFVKTAPVRPKGAPSFFSTFLVTPFHNQDAETGLLTLLKEKKHVFCNAHYAVDGKKITAQTLKSPNTKYAPKDSLIVLVRLNQAA